MSTDHDELTRKRLLRQIERRRVQVKTIADDLHTSLKMFQRSPDPLAANNLAAKATELARFTQSCQDLRDLAELPRGIEIEKVSDDDQ